MKPTGFMTNATGIASQLSEKCNGKHQHVKLLNGRASRAEVYPDELCFRILKGLMETMRKDGRIHSNGIGAVMAEEESETWSEIARAWDDITGEDVYHAYTSAEASAGALPRAAALRTESSMPTAV